MNKHTPGPWVVGEPNKGPVAGTVPVHTADYMESYRAGQLVCSVYGTAAFSDANARLIAAAPDLLDALQKLVGYLDGTVGDYHLENYALPAARSAVAKAIGGER